LLFILNAPCLFILAEPPVVVPISFGKDVFNEGSFAQTMCMVTEGDEPLKIRWSFHGASISSELGIDTQNIGSRTSILIVKSVGHKHNGNYTCRVSNAAGSISSTTQLRVNGTTVNISSGTRGD